MGLAVLLARRLHSTLTLTCVVSTIDPSMTPSLVAAANPATNLSGEDMIRATQYLDNLANKIKQEGVGEISTAVLRGSISQCVGELADRRGSMVVLSSHTRKELAGYPLVSAAAAIVLGGSTPVLLVGSQQVTGDPFISDQDDPILVVVKEGDFAEQMLLAVGQLALATGSRLLLLATARSGGLGDDYPSSLAHLRAYNHLRLLAQQLLPSRVDYSVLEMAGPTEPTIVAVERVEAAALVVLAAASYDGLDRAVAWSSLCELVNCTPAPVLLWWDSCEQPAKELTQRTDAALGTHHDFVLQPAQRP